MTNPSVSRAAAVGMGIIPSCSTHESRIKQGTQYNEILSLHAQKPSGRQVDNPIIFVDVDDTLVRSVGSKRIPVPQVIAAVRDLHTKGATLFLWSSGGADYARSSAIEFGLEPCFAGFIPKPHAYIDDQPVQEWRGCRQLLPANAGEAVPTRGQ